MPKCIRSDNGLEFIAQAIRRWLDQVDVEALYIEPGSPWENGYAESFHSRLRDEFLELEVFESLSATKRLTKQWQADYNHHRPHSGPRHLGRMTGRDVAESGIMLSSVRQEVSAMEPTTFLGSTPSKPVDCPGRSILDRFSGAPRSGRQGLYA